MWLFRNGKFKGLEWVMDSLVDVYSNQIREEGLLEMNDSSSDVITMAANASTTTDDFAGDTTTVGMLELGGTATGTINFTNDSDWFAIELTAGDAIRIAADGVNANLNLRDDLGRFVAFDFTDTDPNENALVFQVRESGTYFVDVSSFGSFLDYTLAATLLEDDFSNTIETTGVLEVDGTVTGTLDFTNDSDWFAIELTAGEAVRIASGAALNLRDQFGNFIEFGNRDFSTGENFILAQVGVSGTYYIDVNENGTSPDYTLTATSLQDDFVSNTGTTGTLAVGGTATGTINFENDSDWFAIELTAGDTIRISSEANLTLLDGFANFVASDFRDFDTNENVLIAQVEESGTFFIAASSFGFPLDYTLSATEITDDFLGNINTTGNLEIDGTVNGEIEFQGDSDWFAIDLTVGDVIRFAINSFDASLSIRDEFGNFEDSVFSDFSGSDQALIFQVQESGTYYVDVSSFGTLFDYTLTASALEDDFANNIGTTGILNIDSTVTGSIDFSGDSDWFAIELTAGEVVRIAADGFDTNLVLRDVSGNTVSFDFRDFGANETAIIAQVEQSGTFYIDVSSFNSPVDYTLTTTVIEDDFANSISTTGVIEPGGAVTATLDFEGDEDWFAITITDTDLGVRFSVDDFGVGLSLFDADGTFIVSSIEGRTLNFSTPGTFFLAASDSFSNLGEYTISSVLVDSVDASLPIVDTGIVDTVVDDANNITYSLTNDGTLIRFSNETDSLLPNVDLGVDTVSLSLSQDGNHLFAAQANLTNVGNGVFEATVLRIDVATSAVETFSFEVTGNGYEITDIQAAADGSLFVTTDFPGSGSVPFYNLSGFDTTFVADIVEDPEFTFGTIRQRTTLDISRDGQFLLLAESNSSAYPVHIYSVEAGEVIASTDHGGFNNDRNAISGEAGLVAVAGFGDVILYDFNLNAVADLTEIFGGSTDVNPVFSQSGDYLFLVNIPFNGSSNIAVVSTSTFEVVSFVELPQNISEVVELDISPDGLSLLVTDQAGVHDLDFSDTTFSIDGTPDNDTFSGTEFDEAFNGLAGDDIVNGGAGDDTLNGGDGIDRLSGDTGNDALDGGAGDDVLRGGDDNDTLRGGADDDRLFGDDGDDFLSGQDGDDRLIGGAGNDRLFGSSGEDVLFAQAGDDILNGGGGADQLRGGAGSDTIIGGAGDDRLFGDSGIDSLSGGAGEDVLTGGGGGDSFAYTLGSGLDAIRDFGNGADTILVDAAFGLSGFEDLQIVQRGVNTLVRLEPGGEDALLLLNTTASDLDASDFVFEEGAGNALVVSDDITPLDMGLSVEATTSESTADASALDVYEAFLGYEFTDGVIEIIQDVDVFIG